MSAICDYTVHRVQIDPMTEWVFLELTTEAGLRGTGETLLGGQEELLQAALVIAASALLGKDPREAAPPPALLADDQATGLLEATVRSAVDQALWDLRAQIATLPLSAMLGPVLRRQVDLYANINRGTKDRSPEGFAERGTAAITAGFDAVKIAPFDGVGRRVLNTPSGRAALDRGIERIVALRAAIGEDATLMVDCHCRFDLPAALRVLDATESVRLDWLEDALPYHDRDGWGRLRSASKARLIGGETARGIRDLVPFMRDGIWDVVMPDVRFFGGVTELMALSPLASQYQVGLAPHNPRGPIGTLASAHAMASCPAFWMLEYQFGECGWRNELVDGAEQIEQGKLALPDAPGLGARLNQDVAMKYRAAPPQAAPGGVGIE